jgi:hypothetical protein
MVVMLVIHLLKEKLDHLLKRLLKDKVAVNWPGFAYMPPYNIPYEEALKLAEYVLIHSQKEKPSKSLLCMCFILAFLLKEPVLKKICCDSFRGFFSRFEDRLYFFNFSFVCIMFYFNGSI